MIKNESKQEWRHPYVSIARGLKSSHGVHSMYDLVFSQVAIIVAYVIVVNVHYTIFMRIKSIIMTSMKVWESFLMIRISTHHWVWQGKMWETLWICVPFFKIIVIIVSQRVLWVVIFSFLYGHQSKWVPKLSMVWAH